MDELTIIKGKVLLDTTYLKIKISLEEIKQKHEHRTDLISSMERSLADLQEVKISLERLLQEEKFQVQTLKNKLEFKDITL
jgi:hypothetical protein